MLFGESNLAFIPVQRQRAQPQGVGGTVPHCSGSSFPKQCRWNNDQALGRIVKNSFSRWAGSSPPVQSIWSLTGNFSGSSVLRNTKSRGCPGIPSALFHSHSLKYFPFSSSIVPLHFIFSAVGIGGSLCHSASSRCFLVLPVPLPYRLNEGFILCLVFRAESIVVPHFYNL